MLDGALVARQCTSARIPGFLWLGLVGRGGGGSHQEGWKREQSGFVFPTLVQSAAVWEVVGRLECFL